MLLFFGPPKNDFSCNIVNLNKTALIMVSFLACVLFFLYVRLNSMNLLSKFSWLAFFSFSIDKCFMSCSAGSSVVASFKRMFKRHLFRIRLNDNISF